MRILTALFLILALASCATAPGRVLVFDETEELDRAVVEAAAAPLVGRGIVVGVFLVERGDATGDDFQGRLAAAGLLSGGQIAPEAIALYVSFEPRYSELRAGTRWSRDLPDEALREVREGALNPALRAGQVTAGVTATLAALEGRLASPPLLQRVLSGFWYAVVAAFALWLLAITPLGEWLARVWRRSPPGRLAQWLSDQTPWGRRRLERITATTRRRLEDRVAYARSWCSATTATPQGPGLMKRLKILDQQRAALDGGALRGRALEEVLDELAWAYTSLGHEASRHAPAKREAGGKRKRKGAAAASAASTAAFTTGAADTYTSSSSSTDSSSSWDSGSSDSGSSPSSDGGSW